MVRYALRCQSLLLVALNSLQAQPATAQPGVRDGPVTVVVRRAEMVGEGRGPSGGECVGGEFSVDHWRTVLTAVVAEARW